ncbi:unnamed protein product [Camellia sinensis]
MRIEGRTKEKRVLWGTKIQAKNCEKIILSQGRTSSITETPKKKKKKKKRKTKQTQKKKKKKGSCSSFFSGDGHMSNSLTRLYCQAFSPFVVDP